jgi:quercetin dioxygenase-like cupin family protein
MLLLGASVMASPFVQAAESGTEPALAIGLSDARLTWSPCPDFIPKGCEIAVLHGDPAQANADVFFKVPAGSSVPHHWHTSAERMILVSGTMTVTYDGQAPVELTTGMYAYGPAKLPHEVACAAGEPCVLFIAFEAPVDAIPTDGAAP